MSGTENNQTGTLDEHLRLGAGFAAADRPRILRALSALTPHLSGWEHDRVDLEVSLKPVERDGWSHFSACLRRQAVPFLLAALRSTRRSRTSSNSTLSSCTSRPLALGNSSIAARIDRCLDGTPTLQSGYTGTTGGRCGPCWT